MTLAAGRRALPPASHPRPVAASGWCRAIACSQRASSALLRAAAAALLLGAGLAAQAVPGFQQVRAAHAVSDLQLTDRHGVPVQTLRVDTSVRRLPWVPLETEGGAMQSHALLGSGWTLLALSGPVRAGCARRARRPRSA